MARMIEQVAEAIHRVSAGDPGGPLTDAPAAAQRLARAQARAAIEAMRKPAPPMVSAGVQLTVHQARVDEAALWRAMLEAALADD